MRIQPTPLHCTKCKHEWIGELVMDALVDIALASMRALYCPSCGAGTEVARSGTTLFEVEPEECLNATRPSLVMKRTDQNWLV